MLLYYNKLVAGAFPVPAFFVLRENFMRVWTEAAKAAQRAAIQRWKPWAKSTGPRTKAGKARSAANACKGDTICKLHLELKALSGRQGRILLQLERLQQMPLPPSLESKRSIIAANLVTALQIVVRDTRAWFFRMLALSPDNYVPDEDEFVDMREIKAAA